MRGRFGSSRCEVTDVKDSRVNDLIDANTHIIRCPLEFEPGDRVTSIWSLGSGVTKADLVRHEGGYA